MGDKKKYEAIIFDLDGTLIDSMPYHVDAFKNLLVEHEIKLGKKEVDELMGLPTVKVLTLLKKEHKFKYKIADLREERRYLYFKLIGTKDITFPGVNELVRKLKKKYKLAIATSSSRMTATYSIKKDFRNLFGAIITIDNVVKGKPNPEQLILAARKLKVKPENCLMVGDSTYDQIAAKKAGMDSIGVLTGVNTKKELLNSGAKCVFKSVNELNKVI